MVALLPKWVMKRFLLLQQHFKNEPFDFDKACKVLRDDDQPIVSLVLSDLRKAGWLEVNINQLDARKRDYTLKPVEQVFKEFLKEEAKSLNR